MGVQKLKYDINREEAKILAWSSGEIHKYKYPAGDEILPSGPSQVLPRAKFTYFPLRKSFQIKNKGEKQITVFKEHGKQLAEINITDKKDDFDTYNREQNDKIFL